MRFWKLALAATLLPSPALAVDLPKVFDKPLKLDVTETTLVTQRFAARDEQNPRDHGWGQWQNKLNVQLTWEKFSFGMRTDSAVYWLRPIDREACATCSFKPDDRPGLLLDDSSRFRDNLYLAKIWGTYKNKNLEVTAGDAYVQFGRGLVLSMRKVDELGIDSTVRGAKVVWSKNPVAVTAVAGFANPTRIDEATGGSLLPSRPIATDSRGSLPLSGSDRIVGLQLQSGRGLPIVLSTHGVRITRCAPYTYDNQGRISDTVFNDPFGSCAFNDTQTWLESLSKVNPIRKASDVDMVGQAIEVPSLWGHGSLYVEGAVQFRREDEPSPDDHQGNALYGSLVTNFGPLTNTFEMKSYRNFYPAAASVETGRASAFSNVQYNNLPTTEILIQDSMYGNFNLCVDGGRLRSDVRVSPTLLVYGAGAYYHSKSETSGSGCDRYGRSISVSSADQAHTYVWDGLSGIEWRFDKDRSQVLFSTGVRDDRRGDDSPFYFERSVNYTFSIFLGGPYSFELNGRHRTRFQRDENQRGPNLEPSTWRQGFHNTAFKIAPKWVFAQGVEYTTQLGQPTYYFNGSILYRFTTESNVRLFVGQQQGGLRCVSGVCRVFPAFEGARAELTLRF